MPDTPRTPPQQAQPQPHWPATRVSGASASAALGGLGAHWPDARAPWWQPLALPLAALAPPHHSHKKHDKTLPFDAVSEFKLEKMGGRPAIPQLDHLGSVAQALNACAAQLADATSVSPSASQVPQAAPPHAAQACGALPSFVPQAALPPGMAYEAFIGSQRQVPTRDNWHDLLAGLIWLRLPRTKWRLNALQVAELARDGVQARRGPVRDACTVFDENAALLHAPDALWQALVQRRWHALFGPLRPLWREASLLVFGHAALEKLLNPYKSITVHVWRVGLPFDARGDLRALDAWLADDLQADKLARKPFAPLPVLGVPGWWPANEAPAFYDDAQVFRAARPAARA